MDAPRFDTLARALATASRRDVLKAAAAGAGAALVARVRGRPAAAAPRRCDGARCAGHEACCPVFDCSGAVCVATPGCVDLRTDPFHCGGCNRECDDACCKGECCFPSGGQACLPRGCGCADHRLTPCGATCVDLRTDRSNCGACDHACPEGTACADGRCGPSAAVHP